MEHSKRGSARQFSGSGPLVVVDRARKQFGDNVVLDDITLEIERGQVAVLIGPSGAGKSTLLRCINGLETLDSGTVSVDGETLEHSQASLNRMRTHIGMVFQGFNLFPHMTALENVTMAPIDVLGTSRADARDRGRELLERVGLGGKADSYPSTLSGGQQQRVAIARALAMDPKLMLFDEPTSALDPELVGEVLSVMTELAQEGMTMAIVTHEMQFAREVGDVIAFLADGNLAEIGPPDQVLGNPQTERAQAFLSRIAQK